MQRNMNAIQRKNKHLADQRDSKPDDYVDEAFNY